MKPAIVALAVLTSFSLRSSAELFSSSTNFVQTLTVASNEVIFVSSVSFTPTAGGCKASILQSNILHEILIADEPWYPQAENLHLTALAGPLLLQCPKNNIHLEFQRVLLTNVFTVFTTGSNSIALDIPPGRSVRFIEVQSNPVYEFPPTYITRSAHLTMSNSVTTTSKFIFGGETFSGPLTATVRAGEEFGGPVSGAMITYCYTEEFATIPAVGAIQVPAGQSQIQVEKSDDMQNWRTVFFNQTPADTRGFYRLKATK